MDELTKTINSIREDLSELSKIYERKMEDLKHGDQLIEEIDSIIEEIKKSRRAR